MVAPLVAKRSWSLDSTFSFLGLSPSHLHLHRDVVLDRHGKQRGWVNLEVRELAGNATGDFLFVPLYRYLEGHVLVMGGLPGEREVKVSVNCGVARRRLRKTCANRDHGILCTPCHLQHVQVTIAVTGIERFDGYGDQEITLSIVADAFATCRVTDAIYLVQGMRNVVRKGALVENPFGISDCKTRQGTNTNRNQDYSFHSN